MKIRESFVTNSSSSSFILGFKSKEDAYSTLTSEIRNPDALARVLEDVRLAKDKFDEEGEDSSICHVTISQISDYLHTEFYYESEWVSIKYFYDWLTNVKKSDESIVQKYKSAISSASIWYSPKVCDIEYGDELREEFMTWYADNELAKMKEKLSSDGYILYCIYSDHDGEISTEIEHEIMPNLSCTRLVISNH